MLRQTLVFALAAFVLAAPLRAAQPSLRDILARAAAYVQDYHRRMTTIVAEERYLQRSAPAGDVAGAVEERAMRSEFMLLPGLPGEQTWFAFRDVFEVDGAPVESTRGRLEAWLGDSRADFLRRARALALEQARYNIGPVVRTINVPTLALEILLPANQERFRFRRTGAARIDGTDVAVISFDERRRRTMIRTPEGKDVRARGTLWIEPATGRVRRTELRTAGDVEATITVAYAVVPRLELLLPASMEERYAGHGARIACTATYSNYRRFETDARIVREDGSIFFLLPPSF